MPHKDEDDEALQEDEEDQEHEEDDDDDDDDDDDEEEDERALARRSEPTKDERSMAMFCHLGNILGVVLPLILWLTQKDKSEFIDKHGKEAVNFGLTITIAHFVVAFVTACCTFGLGNLALVAVTIIYGVQAGQAANRGEDYEYPFTIRMIK